MIELPTIHPPVKLRHSASRVKTFLQCERRAAWYWVRPFEETDASRRGSQIHDVLAAWAERGFDREAFDVAVQLHAGDPLDEAELAAWAANFRGVARYLEPQRSEFWARMTLPGCKWPFVGRVDLLAQEDGVDTVVDWKSTTYRRAVPTQYEFRQDPQALAYALMTETPRVLFAWAGRHWGPEAVVHEFSEEQLRLGCLWLARTCATIERRWETGDWRLAYPNCGLCSKKHCGSYAECYNTG